MIDVNLLEAASRAVEEKQAAGLFSSQGIGRRAISGVRKINPRNAAKLRQAAGKPKIVDAVSEAVPSSGGAKPTGSVNHAPPKGPNYGAGRPSTPSEGRALIPSNNALSVPAKAAPGSNNSLLKALGLGGLAAGGAGATAYGLGGNGEIAQDQPADVPAPAPAGDGSPSSGGGGVLDSAMNYINNLSPTARGALMGGGGAALAGGLYGLMSPGEETVYDDMGRPAGTRRKSRLMSALRNAAMFGAGGAGLGGAYGRLS